VKSETITPGSGEMFDRIAGRYDLLNRLMSFGLDHRWRRRLVSAVAAGQPPGAQILDLATGTGDVALAIARAEPALTVIGVDPSARMLDRARDKISRMGLADRVSVVRGVGEALPFPDDRFAAAAISFGIRNVPDRPRALAELRRVVRPGGRLGILELNEPDREGLVGALARWHVPRVVPTLGAVLSGQREYAYLARSIAAFPPAAEFAQIIAGAGWRQVELEPLGLGAVCLYTARKLG
jgi:demethylmenaquinone methyltransferase/2-methoxy-6-polyprenyl-1,4-benzoquinol methylase